MIAPGKRIPLLLQLVFIFDGRYCSGNMDSFFNGTEHKSTLFHQSLKEIHVEVFKNSNLTGSLQNFTINDNNCKNLTCGRFILSALGDNMSIKRVGPFSVKTSGCIVAYTNPNCKHAGMMIKPILGNITGADLSSYQYIRNNGVGSIRACNSNESEETSEIKFYSKNSTKELIYFGNLRDECSLLPEDFEMKVGNVWSSECVMLYTAYSCFDTNMHSLKVDPYQLINLQIIDEFIFGLSAYRRCSSTEGGEKAEIKFYGKHKYEDYLGSFIAGDLAGCTDLPSNFTVKSAENHGTCLEFYHEPGCSNWGRTVLGGHTYASEFVRKTTPRKNASEDLPLYRSFKLCQTFPSESFNVSVTAFKIQVRTNLSREFLQREHQLVRLGEDKVYVNNGSGNINATYVTKRSIAESVHVEKLQSVSEAMKSLTIEIISQGEIEIPSLLKKKIDAALMSAYTRPTPSFHFLTGCAATRIENREYAIAESFQVPPCTKILVRLSVRVPNFTLEYDVLTHVNGTLPGGDKMSAYFLETSLPSGLEIVRKLDDFTVVAKCNGSIILRFGFEPIFSKVRVPIKYCRVNSGSTLFSVLPLQILSLSFIQYLNKY